MKHSEGSDSLDDAYLRMGQIACRHNWVESLISELTISMMPSYLRRWKENSLRKNFLDKAKDLKVLAETHDLVSADLKEQIGQLVSEALELADERNRLLHAIDKPVIEIRHDVDLGDASGDDFDVSIEFKKGDSIIDTSADKLNEILARYSLIHRGLYECQQVLIESLSKSSGYPEPTLE